MSTAILKKMDVSKKPHAALLTELEALIESGSCKDASSGYIVQKINWAMDKAAEPEDIHNFWSYSLLNNMEWVANIKEYMDLSQTDQKVLFDRNYSKFSWLPVAFKAHEMEVEACGIPLGNGAYLPANSSEYQRLPSPYNSIYTELSRRLLDEIVKPMKELSVTKEEYVLVRELGLFTPNDNLSEEAKITCHKMQEVLKEILTQSRDKKEGFLEKIDAILRTLQEVGQVEKDILNSLARQQA